MDQQLVWGLLGLALLAPIIGAVVLRLLSSTLSPLLLTVSSLAVAGVAIVSVLWLGSSNVNQLQIGNLSLLLPVSRSEGLGFELPAPALPALVPTTPPIGAQAPTLLPLQTATVPAPTATPTLTATLTATPIITATPSLTATLVSTITGSLAVTATNNLTATDALTQTVPLTDSVPEATPQPEPTAEPTPTPSQRTYTVQAGDTLFRIAAQFDVSVEDIIRANNLSAAQADNLTVGQELIIP